MRSVSLGTVEDGRALIASGLAVGERVVTAGAAFLQDGETVTLFQPGTRLTGGTQ
ncbi:Secretion protein HlyD [Pseudomonas syringae pv. castaneae]|uniref:Secretion protein HlyD n=1 Tax=Pseudomonas syringae pv. castaneae TaxID=264450 RepID=A0A0P9N900_PSESX|nr:Secretion protein HlyD [Pseudomonas syringae pv. castaneae]